jgi:hypothetical protein
VPIFNLRTYTDQSFVLLPHARTTLKEYYLSHVGLRDGLEGKQTFQNRPHTITSTAADVREYVVYNIFLRTVFKRVLVPAVKV